MHTSFRARATAALFGYLTSIVAFAEPGIEYRFDAKSRVIGVNAIVDLESAMTEPGSNCSQRIADLVIDEVVYEGASDTIVGFRAQKPGITANTWYGVFSMNTKRLYQNLGNAERHRVHELVKKGAKVVVAYQVCGSGGFASVRDVFAKSAINSP